jgi:hypothetical protein
MLQGNSNAENVVFKGDVRMNKSVNSEDVRVSHISPSDRSDKCRLS